MSANANGFDRLVRFRLPGRNGNGENCYDNSEGPEPPVHSLYLPTRSRCRFLRSICCTILIRSICCTILIQITRRAKDTRSSAGVFGPTPPRSSCSHRKWLKVMMERFDSISNVRWQKLQLNLE